MFFLMRSITAFLSFLPKMGIMLISNLPWYFMSTKTSFNGCFNFSQGNESVFLYLL